MAGSSSSGGDDDYTVEETDPTGQYTRYSKMIDEDDLKKVYLGYDETNGREVAWCKKFLELNNLVDLLREARSLTRFDHENVIKCYHYWVEAETKDEFNMITELYSGNLKDYTQKHQVKENSPAIKKWCQQILTGLDFLQSQVEPIIHRFIKCENIFVVGNSGTIKLGDLSVAETLDRPEYDAVITRMIERSEIYCVGLCALQMVNKDAADSKLRILDMMSLLKKVQDQGLKSFIKACVFPDVGTTITDLLKHPFLAPRTAPSGSTSVPSAWPWPTIQLQPAIITSAAGESEGDIVDSNTAAASEAFNVVERDSSNRYMRFSRPISQGLISKTTEAYYGFDIDKGNIVSWVIQRSVHVDHLIQNANLLKECNNDYVLKVHDFWVADDSVVLITELFSGRIMEYINILGIDETSHLIKTWGRQILKGLAFLNSLEPRIVVTNLNCNHVLFDGVSGCVKLWGFEAKSFPSYESAQNEQTYGFGACLFRMSTAGHQLPISSNVVTQVISTNNDLKDLILLCIGPDEN